MAFEINFGVLESEDNIGELAEEKASSKVWKEKAVALSGCGFVTFALLFLEIALQLA